MRIAYVIKKTQTLDVSEPFTMDTPIGGRVPMHTKEIVSYLSKCDLDSPISFDYKSNKAVLFDTENECRGLLQGRITEEKAFIGALFSIQEVFV